MNDITERFHIHDDNYRHPQRRRRGRIIVMAVVMLVVAVIIGCAVTAKNLSTNEPAGDRLNSFTDSTQTSRAGYGADDGYIPEGETLPYDSPATALSKLDPDLRAALQLAGQAAEAEGVHIGVTSGWRSAEFQRSLLSDAVQRLGEEEAQRVVRPVNASEHVSGRAIDVGPTDAADWMSRYGAEFGLCQSYANELWHYELTATAGQCPQMKQDAQS